MTTRRTFLRGAAVAGVTAVTGLVGVAPATAATRHVLGTSVRGRRILAYRLGPADAPSRYVVIGSMHGDEPVGHRIGERLANRQAPAGVQLWVVPTMNPDGYAAGTRTNARGVDLNRNFAASDWHLQGAGTRYWSGPSRASEPETRAVAAFLRELAPHTVVSIHQPLQCVDYSGGQRAVTRWLADHLHLPAKTLGASGGNLTTWYDEREPDHTAVTVELGWGVERRRVSQVVDVLLRHAAVRAG